MPARLFCEKRRKFKDLASPIGDRDPGCAAMDSTRRNRLTCVVPGGLPVDQLTFWTIATVMVVLVTAAVLAPMFWVRSADEAVARRRQMWAAAAVAALTPLSALGLYAWLGRPDAIGALSSPARSSGAHGAAAGAAMTAGRNPTSSAGDLGEAVARLESRLARQPDDDAGWELLAQSYEYAGRAADAAGARQRRLPGGAGQFPAAQQATAAPAVAGGAGAPSPAATRPAASAAPLDAATLAAVAASLPGADDALVTEKGCRLLTRDVPVAAEAIEALMQHGGSDAR